MLSGKACVILSLMTANWLMLEATEIIRTPLVSETFTALWHELFRHLQTPLSQQGFSPEVFLLCVKPEDDFAPS